jgi:hypothetical protein
MSAVSATVWVLILTVILVGHALFGYLVITALCEYIDKCRREKRDG